MNAQATAIGHAGHFPPELIAQARTQAGAGGRKILELIEELSGMSRTQMVAELARGCGFRAITPATLGGLAPAFDVVAFAEAGDRECLALRDVHGGLLVAVCDPWSSRVRAWAEEHIADAFAWGLIHPADLRAMLSRHEESVTAVESLARDEQGPGRDERVAEDISLKRILEDASPVVRFVNSTLYDAIRAAASDIHFETSPRGLSVKYRIDGVLVAVNAPRMQESADQVLSRIKVMAELDIAERRIPQDGRFRAGINGREIDFRVSVMPSIHGEDAVLRILDKQYLAEGGAGLRVDVLGFDDESKSSLRRLAREPYGMLLVTGPTGSGKTTTLYAVINEINDGRDKIVTIEDPVEYQLGGVLQIPVNEKKGLGFARGLRSILRHDPDKILVGEIRDPETAQIAVQAALTGHLVFTTVHANNVFDVIGRFVHMQVEPYSFVSALNGIVAQRLVRIVCPHCAREANPPLALLQASGVEAERAGDYAFREGAGCGECRGTGFKGRKAIAEVLNLNEEIRELVVARSPFRELRSAARRNGTRFLREQALALVAGGETTLEEINRVTLVS
ncbi:MAG TPA: GspE/PulE family protein [Burkholderiales bacterium]|nr:GspE/PulE family protein [Burkholderiales bacterium]